MLKKICWRKSFLFGSFLVLGIILLGTRSFSQVPSFLAPPVLSEDFPKLPNLPNSLGVPPGQAGQPNWRKPLESYLRALMIEKKLPGIAVQVVSKAGPIAQITLGYRDQEQDLPVTNQTLYAIGSTTKAFTGVVLYQLQEEGKLSLDVPVREYRSDFALKDSLFSDKITLRDMMSHRTGLARHDFVWYHRENETRQSLFGMIPYLEVAAAPRTEFIYNNWMWLAAAVVGEGAEQKSWEDQINERIFAPLGMTGSTTSLNAAIASGDYAHPYVTNAIGNNEVPFYDLGPMNPAGGIYSNLTDMSKWIQFHLNRGSVHGKSVLSATSLADSYKGITPMTAKVSYAAGGWMNADFYGKRLILHDGGIDGFSAHVSLMPDEGLGIVILMNASQVAPESIALRIWQQLLGLPVKDFVREISNAQDEAFKKSVRDFPDKKRQQSALSLESYVGTYCHPVYPKVEIKEAGNDRIGASDLQLIFSVLRHSIYPIGGHQFSILGQYDALKEIEFVLGPSEDGKTSVVQTLKWSVEATLGRPVEFVRCPPETH